MGQGKGGGGEERGSVSSDCSYVIAIKGLAREQSQSLDLIEHGQGREWEKKQLKGGVCVGELERWLECQTKLRPKQIHVSLMNEL